MDLFRSLPRLDRNGPSGLGTVLATDMRDEDRRNIFYRNGEKLMARIKQR